MQGINPIGLCNPWSDNYIHNRKLEEIGMIALKPINVLITKGEISKTGTLAMNLQKPAGEANEYVQFGYGPLKISNTPKDKFQDK